MRRDFLLATWEGGGTVPPVLTVARRLLARGHRVRVMLDACTRADVEAAGAEFVAWSRAPSRPDRSPASDPARDWEAGSPPEKFARLRDAVMTGPALAYAEDTLAELARRPADLVVSSEMLLGVMAAAEAAKRPLAVLSTNVSLFPLPGVPPMGAGLLPARNEAERQQHADFARQVRGLFNGGLPALNTARAAFGLAPLADVKDQLAAAGRILLGTSRAFDFAPDVLPERIRYVGPQLDEPAWAGGWNSPFAANDPRPLLLVAFSTTFQDQGGLVQRVIAALDGLPVRALVTLGPALDPAGLQGAPNVVVARGAPHDAVMREAAAVVCHGGHGTVMRALTHRLPLLCLPMGRDQDDNAARVTARGAGLALPPDAPVGAIRDALRRLIDDPAIRAAARKLGDAVAAEAGSSAVVQELEQLAGLGQGWSGGALPTAA